MSGAASGRAPSPSKSASSSSSTPATGGAGAATAALATAASSAQARGEAKQEADDAAAAAAKKYVRAAGPHGLAREHADTLGSASHPRVSRSKLRMNKELESLYALNAVLGTSRLCALVLVAWHPASNRALPFFLPCLPSPSPPPLPQNRQVPTADVRRKGQRQPASARPLPAPGSGGGPEPARPAARPQDPAQADEQAERYVGGRASGTSWDGMQRTAP